MKKVLSLIVGVVLLCTASASAFASGKWEFTVLGGYGLGAHDDSSHYGRTWSLQFLDPVEETTAIAFSQKSSAAFSASGAFFWSSHFGIQLGLGYFGPKTSAASDWNLTWHWTDTNETFTEQGALPSAGGRLRSIPIFLNFAARYTVGPVEILVTGGPALYLNSIEADSFGLYSDSQFNTYWWGWEQTLDAFTIPLVLDKKWTSLGFNAGLGVSVPISRGLAVSAEARYFACPAKSLNWTWTQGSYNGLFGEISGYSFGGASAAIAGPATTALSVNPSFAAIMGGLSYRF